MLENGAVLSSRYQVLGLIGRGGFGTVYRARDRKTKRIVALKVLHPQLASDDNFLKRFHREALVARVLASPHTVKVLASGNEKGTHYLVLEFVEGLTLRDVLTREGRLETVDALSVAADLASALGEAHAKAIVHRDVKPENVFVTSQVIKLGDFGIASAAELTSLTGIYDQLGSAAYSSPEQVRGEESDARSDVYSLGVVLYEMLLGRPPFSGTPLVVMDAHLHQAPVVADLPPYLREIITRCLAKEPAERYQTAEELRWALEAAKAGGDHSAASDGATVAWSGAPAPTRAATPVGWTAPRGTRRLLFLEGLAVGAVALAVGVGVVALIASGGDGDGLDVALRTQVPGGGASATPVGLSALVSPEGDDCPARLPGEAQAFALPSAEPERSIVQTINCGNAAFAAALLSGDASLLSGAMTGEALDQWQADIPRIRASGYRSIPTTVSIVSIEVNGQAAEVLTRETWTKIPLDGSVNRTTCIYEQIYELTSDSGRWLIADNNFTSAPAQTSC